MRAGTVYRLLVRRGGRSPAWLAGAERLDHVEIVEVASGEVILFWDAAPREASRLVRALRADLAGRDAADFFERWRAAAQR